MSDEQASGFLHVPQVDTHRCEPPQADMLMWVRGLPAGTVWRCACDVVWVVVDVAAVSYGGRTTVAHREWERETRRQRRRRLGLRWWQREASPAHRGTIRMEDT